MPLGHGLRGLLVVLPHMHVRVPPLRPGHTRWKPVQKQRRGLQAQAHGGISLCCQYGSSTCADNRVLTVQYKVSNTGTCSRMQSWVYEQLRDHNA